MLSGRLLSLGRGCSLYSAAFFTFAPHSLNSTGRAAWTSRPIMFFIRHGALRYIVDLHVLLVKDAGFELKLTGKL